MKSNPTNHEPLILPSDEIGWSDESFDLALRYVMHHTTLAEVRDMQDWLRENIAKDMLWPMARSLTFNLYKRPILLTFRNFEPSAMQNAYNEIKQNPRPRLKSRNIIYTTYNIIFTIIVMASILALIKSILLNDID